MPKKEETFLLISLEEEKAKKLAQVISNETCRKILDGMTKGSLTETQISQNLNIPMPTVHYNLKQLVEAGLVQSEEFHYSQKGKEVNHYSLAKKYIIIAPKSTEGLTVKIRHVLPIALIAVVGAGVIQIFSFAVNRQTFAAKADVLRTTAESAPLLAGAVPQVATAPPQIQYTLAGWFLFGALFSLVVYVLFDWLKEKLRK